MLKSATAYINNGGKKKALTQANSEILEAVKFMCVYEKINALCKISNGIFH